jgi:protein-tyrosine phosphatase
MPSVLFVCTANVCRSPLAEVLLRDWLRRQAVPGQWTVGSAGTWAEAGMPASSYSQVMAEERGLTLAPHAARTVDGPLLAAADVILCMSRSHREALQIEFPEHAARIHLWTALAGPPYDIADPYGGPRAGYAAMAAEMEALVEKTGDHIVTLARQREAT